MHDLISKKYRALTFRSKVLIAFICLIIVPVSFILYSLYQKSVEVINREIVDSQKELVFKHAAALTSLSERMLKASLLLSSDPELSDFLQNNENVSNNYIQLQRYLGVQKKMASIRDIILDSSAIVAIIDARGSVYTTLSNHFDSHFYDQLANEPWFERTLAEDGWPVWQSNYEGGLQSYSSAEPLFALSRLIRSPDSGKPVGLLMIGLPSTLLFSDGERSPSNESKHTFILLDERRQPLSTHGILSVDDYQKQVSDKAFTDTYLRHSAMVPPLGWELELMIPRSEWMARLDQFKSQSTWWLFGLFMLFAFAFVISMLHFTRPLRLLMYSMERLGQGDFQTHVEIRGQDEFSRLAVQFNRMVKRLRDVILNLEQEQKRKEEAKFQALQAQINPHFLLNTLNSMKWMAMLSGAAHVSEMMTKLGKLLQYSMRHDRETVPLSEEVSQLQMYMELQNIRFHDRVRLHFHIPEELNQGAILKFTLQPIVENSIVHGKREAIMIHIEAARQNDDLLIRIQDNGTGMDHEQLNQLRDQLRQDQVRYSGVGIRNVHERIRMHYGIQYGLTLSSVQGEGTCVTIRLPFQQVQTEDEWDASADRG